MIHVLCAYTLRSNSCCPLACPPTNGHEAISECVTSCSPTGSCSGGRAARPGCEGLCTELKSVCILTQRKEDRVSARPLRSRARSWYSFRTKNSRVVMNLVALSTAIASGINASFVDSCTVAEILENPSYMGDVVRTRLMSPSSLCRFSTAKHCKTSANILGSEKMVWTVDA